MSTNGTTIVKTIHQSCLSFILKKNGEVLIMEAYHKNHRPHIKVSKDGEKDEDMRVIVWHLHGLGVQW